MPIPSSYTEDSFESFLHRILGADEVAKALGWEAQFDYDECLIETLLTYGVSDITTITASADIRKLRAIGRVEVWRQVMEMTSADYDIKIEGETFSRSQFHEHATAMYQLAEKRASALGVNDYVRKPASVTTVISRRGIDTT